MSWRKRAADPLTRDHRRTIGMAWPVTIGRVGEAALDLPLNALFGPGR